MTQYNIQHGTPQNVQSCPKMDATRKKEVWTTKDILVKESNGGATRYGALVGRGSARSKGQDRVEEHCYCCLMCGLFIVKTVYTDKTVKLTRPITTRCVTVCIIKTSADRSSTTKQDQHKNISFRRRGNRHNSTATWWLKT